MKQRLSRYILAVVMACALMASGCSSTSTGESMVLAPAIVGLSIRQAETKAAAVGCQVEVTSSESSAVMPVDFVLRQDPEPQTVVQKGRIIKVVTSSGPVTVTLANFVGGSFETAQSFITANKLVLGDLVEQVDPSPVGTVLAQDPPANSEVNQGSVVTLTISKGTLSIMPDLVGLSLTEAKKQVAALGLSVSKVIVSAQTTQPPQLVLMQEPVAGDAIEKGGWIELTVSKVP
ncbi:MAG: PASTA domain-containing protein [Candidatus Cryosericum sp.]